ncbi:MAG: enoyl-CoA hydratase/isomerase family protein [SAR324 cluster bacterium]|nr:enoyl-CoA hydratase/isomerase family protein [SAR324 cluster bacterium]
MEIVYKTKNQVGHLEFHGYNGAMDLEHCTHFLQTYEEAAETPETRIIVLWGGVDFFSNGIDLNPIHLRYNPVILAYKNLKALNKIVKRVLETKNKLVIAALRGSAAAGGVMLALAADLRYGRKGIVLNPSYVNMGLSGSEYWSILLPSMIGYGHTQKLIYEANPISCRKAVELGMLHDQLDMEQNRFCQQVREKAEYFARFNIEARLAAKEVLNKRLLYSMEDQVKLELQRMKDCCNHAEFQQARTQFVEKGTEPPQLFPGIALEKDR